MSAHVTTGTFAAVTGQIAGGGVAYSVDYAATTDFGTPGATLDVVSASVLQSLSAGSVTLPTPSTPVPGEQITGSFSVTNTGADPATGSWQNSIYLGTGTTYQPGDTLLQRIPHTGPLAPGASYTVPVSASLPFVPAGSYHLIAVPDSTDVVAAAHNDQQAASASFTVADIPTLTPGTPVTTPIRQGGDLYYRLVVPTTSDVRVSVTLPAGSTATLYAARGSLATPLNTQQQSTFMSTAPSVTLPQSSPGTWFLDLSSAEIGPGSTATIDPELAGLAVTGVTPGTASNTGPVTLTVTGSGLVDVVYHLVSVASHETIGDIGSTRQSSTTVFPTFPLAGAPPGSYDLVVGVDVPNGQQVTFPNAVTVTAGTVAGQLEISTTGGGNLRYGWISPMSVTLSNTGGADVAIPELTVAGVDGEVIPALGLYCNPLTLGDCSVIPGTGGFRPSITLFDPAATPIPGEAPFPAGILPPGRSETFQFGVISSTTTDGAPITVNTTVVNSTDPTPIDWPTLLDTGQPPGLTTAQWNSVVALIERYYGTTEGQYAAALVPLIRQAQGYGVTLSDDNSILAFIIDQTIVESGSPFASVFDSTTNAPLARTPVTFTSTTNSAPAVETTTWYDGTFSFLGGLPDGTYDVSVGGHLPRTQQVTILHGALEGLRVVVTDGARLTGTVTRSDTSAPVSGATVTATDADGPVSANTAADGTYIIDGLDTGAATVTVIADLLAGPPPMPVVVSAAAPTTQDLSMSPAGEITGQITETPAGSPAVLATAVGGGAQTVGDVAPGGSFVIGGLPTGSYQVTATDSGLGAATSPPVSVTVGSVTSGVDLTLDPPATITGTVTDAVTGQPIVGATVTSLAPGGPPAAVTNASGTYSLAGAPGASQTIETAAPGSTTLDETVSPASGATLTHDFVLSPKGSLSASVLDGGGAPLANQDLVLAAPSPAGGAQSVGAQHLTTDAAGAADLTGLDFGTYVLSVPGSDATATFTLDNAHLAASVTLTVPTGILTGTVLTAGGGPAGGVPVTVADGSRPIAGTQTAADGTYSFTVTAAGSLDVVVTDPTVGILIDSAVSVVTGATTTAPTLQGGSSTLAVTVNDGGGVVTGAFVSVTSGSVADQPASVATVTDASGSASFASLVPGTYQLKVAHGSDATSATTVVVAAGANTSPVALSAGGSVAGTVSGASGPVTGAQVVAVGSVGSMTGQATTAADGTYSIAGLAPDTYQLSVSDGKDAPAIVSGVAVTAGTGTVENVTLSPTGTDLTVTEQAAQPGGPLPGAAVMVVDASGTPVLPAIVGPAVLAGDPTDSTVLGPLSPGHYTVELVGTGTSTNSLPVTIGGSPASLTLIAPAGEVLPDQSIPPSPALRPAAQPSSSNPFALLQPNASSPTQALPSWTDVLSAWIAGLDSPTTHQPVMDQVTALYNEVIANLVGQCGANSGPLIAQLGHELIVVQRAYGAIDTAYKAFNQNRYAGLALSAFNVVALVGHILDILLSGAAPIKAAVLSLNSESTFVIQLQLLNNVDAGTEDAIKALDIANLVTTVGIIGQSISEGPEDGSSNFDNIVRIIGILNDGLKAIQAVAAFGSAIPGLSALAAGIAAVKELVSLFENLKIAYDAAVQDIDNYNTAQTNFLTLATAMIAHLNSVNQSISTTGCPPPPPPPYPPPPPGPVQPPAQFQNNLGKDPNGIDGPPGVGVPRFVAGRTGLGYVIHFQNEPTASASVAEVTVTEPVPADVDPASVQLTGFGYGSTVIFVPPGLQTFSETIPDSAPNGNGDSVTVTGAYDRATSTITWTLSAINPATGDVDAAATGGFLPPDNTDRTGEGFVSYSGTLQPGLASGTTVTDQATITFDRNAPIDTPAWTNTVDATAPTATVTALPPTTRAGSLPVSWTGSDGAGSGAETFDVYVSVDGGPLTVWQHDTTATSASYPTIADSSYGFAAVATDQVGNAGPVPTAPQTTTRALLLFRQAPAGYWLAGADGGVYAFGDAGFHGSMGGHPLNAPVIAMTTTPDGGGYWLLGADGAVYAFGDAGFQGSMGGHPLNAPVIAMTTTPDGRGYWLLGADGAVYAYGDATFQGSMGGHQLAARVVAVLTTGTGNGYWLVGADGAVYAFGDATFQGSMGGTHLSGPIVTATTGAARPPV